MDPASYKKLNNSGTINKKITGKEAFVKNSN